MYRCRSRRMLTLSFCARAAAKLWLVSIATICSTRCWRTTTRWRTPHSRSRKSTRRARATCCPHCCSDSSISTTSAALLKTARDATPRSFWTGRRARSRTRCPRCPSSTHLIPANVVPRATPPAPELEAHAHRHNYCALAVALALDSAVSSKAYGNELTSPRSHRSRSLRLLPSCGWFDFVCSAFLTPSLKLSGATFRFDCLMPFGDRSKAHIYSRCQITNRAIVLERQVLFVRSLRFIACSPSLAFVVSSRSRVSASAQSTRTNQSLRVAGPSVAIDPM